MCRFTRWRGFAWSLMSARVDVDTEELGRSIAWITGIKRMTGRRG